MNAFIRSKKYQLVSEYKPTVHVKCGSTCVDEPTDDPEFLNLVMTNEKAGEIDPATVVVD